MFGLQGFWLLIDGRLTLVVIVVNLDLDPGLPFGKEVKLMEPKEIQGTVLHLLSTAPGMSESEIADHLGLSRRVVGKVLKYLVSAGEIHSWVSRKTTLWWGLISTSKRTTMYSRNNH